MITSFLVTYDLSKPGANYEDLIEHSSHVEPIRIRLRASGYSIPAIRGGDSRRGAETPRCQRQNKMGRSAKLKDEQLRRGAVLNTPPRLPLFDSRTSATTWRRRSVPEALFKLDRDSALSGNGTTVVQQVLFDFRLRPRFTHHSCGNKQPVITSHREGWSLGHS